MNTSRLHVDKYKNGILGGDRIILARAITLIESTLPGDQQIAGEVLDAIITETGDSLRVGITGAPGVGKSTFIETFGTMLVESGKKLAVLTIDPSSQLTGGSILGDKTRMSGLARDPRVFIRPSPSGHTLGGVATHTRETILLCEAAGFDYIIVETVGTGQSEIAIKHMVDFFLLLMQPGSGDELQGIKKGIVEMADAIAITKADGDNLARARATHADFQHALHLMKPPSHGETPKVVMCSALHHAGLGEIREMIDAFGKNLSDTGRLQQRRHDQYAFWFREQFQHLLSIDPKRYQGVVDAERALIDRVRSGTLSPRHAAQTLLASYYEAISRSGN